MAFNGIGAALAAATAKAVSNAIKNSGKGSSSSGRGSSSKSGGSSKSSSGSSVYGKDTDWNNERNYLNNLIAGGGGNADWATNQMKLLDQAQGQYVGQNSLSPLYPNNISTGKSQYNDNYVSPQYEKYIESLRAEQEEAARKQTEATVNSIYAYKPQVEQDYQKQAQANYIANMKAKNQMGDYLSAMGYTGGLSESTLQGLQSDYQNARSTTDQERNNAINQIEQLAAQARMTGDANLANLAGNYYDSYLSALNQAQAQSNWERQFDYQKQQDDYNRFADNIYANYSDLEAYAQRLMGQGYSEDSPEVRAVRSAAQKKILAMQAQEESRQLTEYERLYPLLQQGKISPEEFIQRTGIPIRW